MYLFSLQYMEKTMIQLFVSSHISTQGFSVFKFDIFIIPAKTKTKSLSTLLHQNWVYCTVVISNLSLKIKPNLARKIKLR